MTCTTSQDSPSRLVQRLKSSLFGSVLTTIAVTPFDVIKVRMQSAVTIPSVIMPKAKTASVFGARFLRRSVGFAACVRAAKSSHSAADAFRPTAITGLADGVRTIVRQEGFFKLWRGVLASFAMSIPATVIYFGAYEELRDFLMHTSGPLHIESSSLASLVAGGGARVLAVSAISPIELFRTRMMSMGRRGTFADVTRSVILSVQRDGLRSLWRGLPPTLWRDVPFSAIYWSLYDLLKTRVVPRLLPTPPSQEAEGGDEGIEKKHILLAETVTSLVCGATAGTVAATVTTPFDVVKTKIQTLISAQSMGGLHVKKTTAAPYNRASTARLLAMLKGIYRAEGASGLMRGVQARVAKCAPSCAIMITSYEVGKHLFK